MNRQIQQAVTDAVNYENDSRVRAGKRGDWFSSLDESKMKATALIFDDETGDEVEVETRFEFQVCGCCEGKGSHVNPSIDAGGLSAGDFHADPDFAEEYFAGRYDVACYECHGKRVVPVPTDQRVTQRLQDIAQAAADHHAERMAEINFGC